MSRSLLPSFLCPKPCGPRVLRLMLLPDMELSRLEYQASSLPSLLVSIGRRSSLIPLALQIITVFSLLSRCAGCAGYTRLSRLSCPANFDAHNLANSCCPRLGNTCPAGPSSLSPHVKFTALAPALGQSQTSVSMRSSRAIE